MLLWLIEGYIKYKTTGLNPPLSGMGATDNYVTENDAVFLFMESTYEVGDSKDESTWIQASQLYEAYEQWCSERRLEKLGSRTFGMRLNVYISGQKERKVEKGQGKGNSKGKMFYKGLLRKVYMDEWS